MGDATGGGGFTVENLDHVALTVADIGATVAFYSAVLGMAAEEFAVADGTRRWALRFGEQKINLHRADAEFEPKAMRPGPGTADLCFLSAMPVAEWAAWLARNGVTPEQGPVRRTGALGPILSVYLRDPDGNLIEIANRL